MKKAVLLLVFAFYFHNAAAETIISGTVRDSQTKELLPYVSIGIKNKNIGTVSNRNGEFVLRFGDDILPSDMIMFFCIGYETKEITVSGLEAEGNSVQLSPVSYDIGEVRVSNRKSKYKKLGRSTSGTQMMVATVFSDKEIQNQDFKGKEFGTVISVKKDALINGFNFYIKDNHYQSVKFRLNFYSVEDGEPQDIIVNKNIVFEVEDGYTGWYSLDLSPYGIFLQGVDDVLVTLTLLDENADESANRFWITAAFMPNKGLYSRLNIGGEWKKQAGVVSYCLDAQVFKD